MKCKWDLSRWSLHNIQLIFLFVVFVGNGNDAVKALSTTERAHSRSPSKTVTISVCTDVDCRLDGASDCLRRLQQEANRLNRDNCNSQEFNSNDIVTDGTKSIYVESRACIGPCGDGPNVLVLDNNDDESHGQSKRPRRVFPNNNKQQQQPNRLPGSLAPAEMFGDNPRGVYQVRLEEHVDFVMKLAAETAGIPYERLINDNITETNTKSQVDRHRQLASDKNALENAIVNSSRPWYDRPRNERRVLQRLMQVLVLAGLYLYDKSHGSIGQEQWIVAGLLGLASNLIMRENILLFLWDKAQSK